MVEEIDDDQMSERIARMGRILDNRAGRERLYERRVAICRQLVYAAEAKLTRLCQEQTALRNATSEQLSATAHWHQQRQRALADLDRRITRIQRTRQRLKQRASCRQAELVNAAQLRRAAEKAITRLQQQATQAAQRSSAKRFDDLVRTVQVIRNPNFNATST